MISLVVVLGGLVLLLLTGVPVFPGMAIAVAVLGVNLLGDALNDFWNPRSRSAGASG